MLSHVVDTINDLTLSQGAEDGAQGWQNIEAIDIYFADANMCYASYRSGQVKLHQAINCVPGAQMIGRSSYLLRSMTTAYGNKAFNVIPKSFVLPKEIESLTRHVKRNQDDMLWTLRSDQATESAVLLEGGRLLKFVDDMNTGKREPKYRVVQQFMKDQYLVKNRPAVIRLVDTFNTCT